MASLQRLHGSELISSKDTEINASYRALRDKKRRRGDTCPFSSLLNSTLWVVFPAFLLSRAGLAAVLSRRRPSIQSKVSDPRLRSPDGGVSGGAAEKINAHPLEVVQVHMSGLFTPKPNRFNTRA